MQKETQGNAIIDGLYQIKHVVGEGATCKVSVALDLELKEEVAIKIFDTKQNSNKRIMLKTFRNEIDIMKKLRHRNLINIIDANEEGKYNEDGQISDIMYIAMEYAPNGALHQYIIAKTGLQETHARYYFKQLIDALKSMHDINLAHRDLKPENLFLDKNYFLKVGDFGISKFMVPGSLKRLKTNVGTNKYKCPEMNKKRMYSGESNDIFACGVILFEMLKGCPPFLIASETNLKYKYVAENRFDEFWELHAEKGQHISPEGKKLIIGMINFNNEKRYTLKQVLNDPWMRGKVPSHEEVVKEMIHRQELRNAERQNRLNKVKKVEPFRERKRESLLLISQSGSIKEKLLYQSFEKLEEYGWKKWKVKEWANFQSADKLISFDGLDAIQIYKKIISDLIDLDAEIEFSHNYFSLSATIFMVYQDQDKHDKQELGKLEQRKNSSEDEEDSQKKLAQRISFQVNLYADKKKNSIVANFHPTGNTNIFVLEEVFKQMFDLLHSSN